MRAPPWMLLPLLFACTHPAPVRAAPTTAALDEASLSVLVIEPTADDAKAVEKAATAFAKADRHVEATPLDRSGRAELVRTLRDVDFDLDDATSKRIDTAPASTELFFHWKPADAGALEEAYATIAKLAAAPGRLVADVDIFRLPEAKDWSELAADAAKKPPHAPRHFVNQFFPEKDGTMTVATAGLQRFGLRELDVRHVARSSVKETGEVLNLLAQRWTEGQRPKPDGTIVLRVDELVEPDQRAQALDPANGTWTPLTLRLTADHADGQDVEVVTFPGQKGDSDTERIESALHSLFGVKDSTEVVDHSQALLEVSRKARERAIRELKPRVRKGLPAGETLLVKAPFPYDGGNEWMWVEVTAWKGTKIRGPLEDQPEYAKNVRSGEIVEVDEKDIFDFMDEAMDGTFVGNDTGRFVHPELFEELPGGRRRVKRQ